MDKQMFLSLVLVALDEIYGISDESYNRLKALFFVYDVREGFDIPFISTDGKGKYYIPSR